MQTPLAEIINIGDEILYGQITNTNAQGMSEALNKIGVNVVRHTVINDDENAILKALEEAEKRCDIILLTGGLGPTKDDITKKTLCKFFGTELVMNEEALAHVSAFFSKRKIEMLEINKWQAALPSNATYIKNSKGTAPGMWFEHNGKVFVSMPGVPYEMKHLMEYYVVPHLQNFFQTPHIVHKMIKTVGVGESYLADKIETWEDNLPPHIRLAYLPSFGMVRLRLTGIGDDVVQVEKDIEAEVKKVLPTIHKSVYGFDDDELPFVVGRMLANQGKTLATAESCTGGFLAYSFTQYAGSSDFFTGSVVAYSNEVKMKVLGVEAETLEKQGAVSEETVLQMAAGVRKALGTDIGVATSGIAGPGGGTETKPVGTIWVGYSDAEQTVATLYQLTEDRMVNIRVTSNLLIDWIRRKNGYNLKKLQVE
ncbi:MAG: competence/damage-inducible protein A [Thermonemataceae bacterium]